MNIPRYFKEQVYNVVWINKLRKFFKIFNNDLNYIEELKDKIEELYSKQHYSYKLIIEDAIEIKDSKIELENKPVPDNFYIKIYSRIENDVNEIAEIEIEDIDHIDDKSLILKDEHHFDGYFAKVIYNTKEFY
jgi:hypothetical protein